MAGHSKWSNIKHRKGRQDAKKGKVFTRISKEIFSAVREGGEDPKTNARLKAALIKAKEANMPSENVDRTIKKATGNLEGVTYETVTYEGYGPHGTAVFIEALTDNRNRTAAEIRLAFNKNGGNLGENGCVAYMFKRMGILVFEDVNEQAEELTFAAIEAGAEDVHETEASVEVFTSPGEFENVRQFLADQGFKTDDAEVGMVPDIKTDLTEDQSEEVLELIDVLEENEDIQSVYHNLS
ncbi:YebC/PmpR family DNA-binding transcriptional regulator [Alteribacter natronophilus]|uniref:YebC/PmpR family DNA-binding transcriptional regulator n=1 Tax=Alteribacter natronophilus TaxID=2583810 RepID=UPI00110D3EFD|nr:YebC/PmpR family DNA-binding transcriptional regulator [Alteribacter natronophilus]TMW73981.1 YebC/PmpR family DNA-binding transcriptional regulator [Alteribacter natronophilus]